MKYCEGCKEHSDDIIDHPIAGPTGINGIVKLCGKCRTASDICTLRTAMNGKYNQSQPDFHERHGNSAFASLLRLIGETFCITLKDEN